MAFGALFFSSAPLASTSSDRRLSLDGFGGGSWGQSFCSRVELVLLFFWTFGLPLFSWSSRTSLEKMADCLISVWSIVFRLFVFWPGFSSRLSLHKSLRQWLDFDRVSTVTLKMTEKQQSASSDSTDNTSQSLVCKSVGGMGGMVAVGGRNSPACYFRLEFPGKRRPSKLHAHQSRDRQWSKFWTWLDLAIDCFVSIEPPCR